MRKFINRVALTGANDFTNPEELLAISREFPFVEWGILLSETSMGTPRFPSYGWLCVLAEFYKEHSDEVHFSGHLCGKWVREWLEKGITAPMWTIIPFEMFDRFQVNTHAEAHKLKEGRWVLPQGVQWIAQYDNVNTKVIDMFFDAMMDVAALFDLSHGAGVLPSEWPEHPGDMYCGYAGGLSPANVADQIERISSHVPKGQLIWVDAETHLRTDHDTTFNLRLCREFLENCAPYVVEG